MLLQAKEDLLTAQTLKETARYYASVFFSQQAAEKALKALYMYRFKKSLFTHDLTELASALDAPEFIKEAARELTPDYFLACYPNISGTLPANLYHLKEADEHLTLSHKVIQWVDTQFRGQ